MGFYTAKPYLPLLGGAEVGKKLGTASGFITHP
jgi:hypothetical protein